MNYSVIVDERKEYQSVCANGSYKTMNTTYMTGCIGSTCMMRNIERLCLSTKTKDLLLYIPFLPSVHTNDVVDKNLLCAKYHSWVEILSANL